jgi:hypothetical protein
MTPSQIHRNPVALLLAFAVFAIPRSAQAQFEYKNIYTGRSFNNPMSASLDLFVHHGMQRRMMYRGMLQRKGYASAEIDRILRTSEDEIRAVIGLKDPTPGTGPAMKVKETPAAKPVNPVPASRFKPTGKRLLLNKAADALGTTVEEKAAYKTIFAEVAKAYEGEAKRLGFPNDIAGAMAFFADTSYTLYKPDFKPNSDEGSKALVRQFQEALDSDELRKAPAAEKQQLYEYYVALGAYLYTLSEVAKESKDDAVKAGVVKLGGDGLKMLLKVDPSRVSLTANGLEIEPE